LAKGRQYGRARALDETSGEMRTNALLVLSRELAKSGQFSKATQLATNLGEDGTAVLCRINVEMPRRARVSRDPNLMNQAKAMAQSLSWTNQILDLWAFSFLCGDTVKASNLLRQAE